MTSLRVDKYHLDAEWQALPEDIVNASKRVSAAKALLRTQELKKTRLGLDRRRAVHQAKMAIRKNPANYGLERATIDAVNDTAAVFKSVLALDEAILDLEEAMSETQTAIDAAWSVLEGLRTKKDSLQDLVGLFKIGYFSRSAPRIETERPGGLNRKPRTEDDTGFEG